MDKTQIKQLLNLEKTIIEKVILDKDASGKLELKVEVRLTKGEKNVCPICGKKGEKYDKQNKNRMKYRGLDLGGVKVWIYIEKERITCKKHGVITERIPWAYAGSNFTKDFDREVAYYAMLLPKSTVSSIFNIDWKTVGRCISRTLEDLEPDRKIRYNNLKNIGIDETSYKKGHNYITVVVNHDTNEVVWVSDGYVKNVLENFFQDLTIEQREGIETVTGDGARWISSCVEEYLPNAKRCVDAFHVVQWSNETLDSLRKKIWREKYIEAKDEKKN